MGLLEAIKKAFGKEETFDIDITLGNGDIVTVITEAQEPQAGDEVKKEDGSSLEDGSHVTKDGDTLEVEGGVIKNITPKEEPTAQPTNEEIMQSVNSLTRAFSTFKEKDKKEKADNDEAMNLMFEEVKDLGKKFETLAKSVGSNFNITDDGDDPNNPTTGKSGTLESLRERKKQYKTK